VPAECLPELQRVSHAIAELANIAPDEHQPFVGGSAFAHKAGLHASAIKVDPDLYQHADPRAVGNDMRMLVSDMAGRASIELKGRELGFDLAGQGELLTRVTNRVKESEARGYTYDAADASFELLLREELTGERPEFFRVESWRTIVETVADVRGSTADRHDADAVAEATVKLHAGGERIVSTGEGNGPVNALDQALRSGLTRVYPDIDRFELIDFKVRILDSEQGTDATTRVLVETTDGQRSWSTVGVGPNVIEAAWEALIDAHVYRLLHAGVDRR
jgi:2-isopropylmalate synthase